MILINNNNMQFYSQIILVTCHNITDKFIHHIFDPQNLIDYSTIEEMKDLVLPNIAPGTESLFWIFFLCIFYSVSVSKSGNAEFVPHMSLYTGL